MTREINMARVSTYLNFARETEAAFLFYREVFGGEFNGPITGSRSLPAARVSRPCPRRMAT